MAKGKLSEDQIKWVLSVESTVAQQEIHKLTQENKELAKEQRELRKRMTELVEAGKKNSEEYDRLTVALNENKKAAEQNKTMQSELLKQVDLSSMSMNELKKRAKELREQLDATSRADNAKAWDEQKAQLDAVNSQMSALRKGSQSLMSQLSSVPGPAGMAARGISGVAQAAKLLLANPLGLFLTAIVAAFYALKTAIAGSDEGRTKLRGWMDAFAVALDAAKRNLTELGAILKKVFTFEWDSLGENVDNLKQINGNLIDNMKNAYDAAIAEDALNDAIARNNDVTEVNKSRIAELRLISRDVTKSYEERKAASNELMELEKKNYEMAVSNTSNQLDIFLAKHGGLSDALKSSSKEEFKRIEEHMKSVREMKELTYKERLELANLVNDITRNTDRATEEEKEKFRAFFSELSSMQESYFKGIRRDKMAEATMEEEQRREREAAAKKGIAQALSNADAALTKETNRLKEQLASRLISRKDYERAVEKLTADSIAKKLKISGIEQSQRVQLEGQLLDLKLKRQDDEAREFGAHEKNKLDMLKSSYDTELKLYNDTAEALRISLHKQRAEGLITEGQMNAAISSIDKDAAEHRLQIQQNYHDDVLNLDIRTLGLKEKYIEDANSRVLTSEKELASALLEVRKQLETAVTDYKHQAGLSSVDDERQMRIASLEAAYQERIALLKREHQDTQELEQAHQKALAKIESEYNVSKAAARKSVGIATLMDMLSIELEGLKKVHEQGLISEQEYQKARKALIINMSAEVASSMIAKISDSVNALKDAELAGIDAKYDAELQAAQGNQEKMREIEEKKEAEKLSIQKKYADVQFAVKVSEIIANTAVAIMQAYAQLGPIGGSVAAALLAVTGAAQVAVANAERQKVKNAQPGGGAQQTGGMPMRVASGREAGGYIDVEREQDGKRFRAMHEPRRRGYVDRPTVIVGDGPAGRSREWVAGNDALSNPTVAPIIRMLDAAQLSGQIRTIDMEAVLRSRLVGHESGGYIDRSSSSPASSGLHPLPSGASSDPRMVRALERFVDTLDRTGKEGIRASVVYSDMERKRKIKERSEDVARKR